MKTQRLVTNTFHDNWERELDRLLEDGWTVVPGTMAVSVSDSTCAGDRGAYAVIVEKDTND